MRAKRLIMYCKKDNGKEKEYGTTWQQAANNKLIKLEARFISPVKFEVVSFRPVNRKSNSISNNEKIILPFSCTTLL